MDAPVSVKDLFDGNGKFKLLIDLPKRVRSRLLRAKTDGDGRIYSFAFKPHPKATMREVARVAFFDPGKLFDDKGRHELARAPKIELARALIAHIARLLPKK